MAHQIDSTISGNVEKCRLKKGILKLAKRKQPIVKVGTRGSAHIDPYSLLRATEAGEVLSRDEPYGALVRGHPP